MNEEVHPLAGIMLMVADQRAKLEQAETAYKEASDELAETGEILPEIIKPYLKELETFLVCTTQKIIGRPNAGVDFSFWVSVYCIIGIDLFISARLYDSEVETAEQEIIRLFNDKCLELTGVTPDNFHIKLRATQQRRDVH